MQYTYLVQLEIALAGFKKIDHVEFTTDVKVVPRNWYKKQIIVKGLVVKDLIDQESRHKYKQVTDRSIDKLTKTYIDLTKREKLYGNIRIFSFSAV